MSQGQLASAPSQAVCTGQLCRAAVGSLSTPGELCHLCGSRGCGGGLGGSFHGGLWKLVAQGRDPERAVGLGLMHCPLKAGLVQVCLATPRHLRVLWAASARHPPAGRSSGTHLLLSSGFSGSWCGPHCPGLSSSRVCAASERGSGCTSLPPQ